MSDERATNVALHLMRLGVSKTGVYDLLAHYPVEVIERQLAYLPYRKAKRPEAFIIDAVRGDYSTPHHFHYAQTQPPGSPPNPMDEDAEHPRGPTTAGVERHRTQGAVGAPPPDDRLEP